MLCSDSDFYRLTCFYFVLNPHILDTAGSTETYFDLNLEERRIGRGKSLGGTNGVGRRC